jgi:4-hydroxy-tetrahydrodipicolinate reductase
MADKVRVVIFGLGPVGCGIANLAARKKDVVVVGAIDLRNVGKDLGEIAKVGRRLGIRISDDAAGILKRTKPDVVLHATASSFPAVYPQLAMILKTGACAVSTCEELSYPYRKSPRLAAALDKLAKKHKAAVMSTGVNPGFLMDTWPLAMTAVCQEVKKIRSVRIQDASPRRLPFQKKIGAGKTLAEFRKLVKSGEIRHVGLPESIAMIAAGLGWKLDKIAESIGPIVAAKPVRSRFLAVKAGQAAGVKQIGRGFRRGKEVITLEFQAYLGAEESYDAVFIRGLPDMEVVIKGGTHGDVATASMVVNSVPRILQASPGLVTMKDIPMVSATPNR